MSFTDKINEDLKSSMKARDEVRTRGLRAIKSALLLLATEKAGATITPEAEVAALQKLAKQRKDSMEIFKAQNRDDLYQKEKEELEVIQTYLPAQMSEEDIRAVLVKIVAEKGAKSPADTGKVMPVAMKELAGKADGKTISAILKELLS